ncbi:putative F-box/LRR-repeat protein 23 [Salvia hispanica]|uniref:putative F-box/LRR-repeat protein 23 n=1 Tax=Salvia hispanica TaxID=49212 RepID=UPI002009BEA6|nr:putative F-box/LRR-repeat protein 23 [Salvia hispanica]
MASSSSAAIPPSPPWTELPEELTANILQRLRTEEILKSAQRVCTTWWRVCRNPTMWRAIDLHYRRCAFDEFESIFRCAVDRSQGQLVDLKLACFEGDRLLNYAVERSTQLRCLTLVEYGITGITLAHAMKKVPQLEELHLMVMPMLTLKDFESIGISCPMLKSFIYYNYSGVHLEFTEYAVAIGKTMPNLHHLRLSVHRMENKGLKAILDGCPHLESLDLQGCAGLDLKGALGKRCSNQIKDLWLDLAEPSFQLDDWDDEDLYVFDNAEIGYGDVEYDPDYY